MLQDAVHLGEFVLELLGVEGGEVGVVVVGGDGQAGGAVGVCVVLVVDFFHGLVKV